MSTRLFEGASHAAIYAKFRPSPPKELVNAILDYLSVEIPRNEWKVAADTGCGSGQSTRIVAPYFQTVYGFDISDAQINEANKTNDLNNVIYKTSPSESLPLDPHSCQLLTASQSAHWYDIDKYFVEAKRILVPNGVSALYVYKMPIISHPKFPNDSRIYNFVDTFYKSPLLSWNKKERENVDNGYTSFTIPLNDFVRRDDFVSTTRASAYHLKGYLQSWSGYNVSKTNDQQKAETFMNNFDDAIKDIFGDMSLDKIEFDVSFRYSLLMGRNPKTN